MANIPKPTQINILKNTIDKSKWNSNTCSHNLQKIRGKKTKEIKK